MDFKMDERKGRIRVARLRKNHAECDLPKDTGVSEIRIGTQLRGQKELRFLLHELLHFADYSKDEDWVDDVSRAMAGVLWRWGYRKQN